MISDLEVRAALIDSLAKSRDVARDQVLLELRDDGFIDSLEGVELIVHAEQTFGITVSDKELSSEVCQSVSRLTALVRTKLDANN